MHLQLHYFPVAIFLALFLFSINSTSLSAQSTECQVSTFAGPAPFNDPRSVAVDGSGTVFVADQNNNLIRMISPAGVISMVDFGGFDNPSGVAVDCEDISMGETGVAYIADRSNHVIRRIDIATQTISTVAGEVGTSGNVDGTAGDARFRNPLSVAVNGNFIYVADRGNDAIRRIDKTSGEVTTIKSGLNNPTGIATDRSGNIYVANRDDGEVLRLDPAGNEVASFQFPPPQNPTGVTVDRFGNIYVTERLNQQISRIDQATGSITVIAGSGATGAINGPGSSATFDTPSDIAVDASGNIYVADRGNNLIRRIICPTPSAPVPTMSEWGLMIFGLLVLNVSVFYIREQELVLG